MGMIWPVAAQPADILYAELDSIAHVPFALRLASDSQGILYVVTGREVVQLDTSGEVRAVLGGSGSSGENGAFAEVVDIDPDEGLVWVVVDAGQGRLMRFSRTLMHLESLPVPRADDVGFDLPSRREPRNGVSTADGRPIAVTVTPSGELFAIEEDAQAVIKWDASRRLERVIGKFGDMVGRLVEPINLAADEIHLYVADRGLRRVQVYDFFGGFVRAYPSDASLVSMETDERALFMVHTDRVRVYSREGEFRQQINFTAAAPVTSAALAKGQIYLLLADVIWHLKYPNTR